jgi:hypothetical protein
MGFALTVLAWLPVITSTDRHDMAAAIIAMTISAPALLISRRLGIPLSTEGFAPLVYVSPITNMALLAVPFGLIGYCTRFFRHTWLITLLGKRSPCARGLIIGASIGLALTVLGFLPEAATSGQHDEFAGGIALIVSLPALFISYPLGIDFSTAALVLVSTITNTALLAAPFGLIGHYTRFFGGTRW